MIEDLATLGIRADTRSLKDVRSELNRVGQAGEQTERKLNSSVDSLNNNMAGLRKTIGLVGIGLAAITSNAVFRNLTQYADQWKQVNNTIRQVSDSEEDLRSTRQRLLTVSKETNTELAASAQLYAGLYRSTRDLEISQQRVASVTKTINNLFLAGGRSAQEASGSIRQLIQGLEAGALRGEEFNSVAEGAPRIMDALGEHLKMTRGELRDFAAEGSITSEIIVEALEKYEEKAQAMADMTDRTFGQKMVNAGTNVTTFVGQTNALNTVVGTTGDLLVGLSENLDLVVDAATALAIVVGGRLAGSITASTQASIKNTTSSIAQARATATATAAEIDFLRVNQASLVAQLQQAGTTARASALRKQLAGNTAALTATTRAHTSAVAASSIAARAAATSMGILRSSMALVGGPVGVAVTAAAGVFIFREELLALVGVTNKAEQELYGVIEAMKEAEKTAEVIGFEGSLKTARDQLAGLEDDLNQAMNRAANTMLHPENSPIVKNLQARIDRTETLIELNKGLLDIAKLGKREMSAEMRQLLISLEATNTGTEDLITKTDELMVAESNLKAIRTGSYEKVIQDAEDYADRLQVILDKLYPQQAEVRRLMAEWDDLYAHAKKDGEEMPKILQDWIDQNILITNTTRKASEEVAGLGQEAEPFGKIWDTTLERLQGAFADIFYNILEQGKVTFDNILDLFKRMVAEMAAKKVMLSIGMGGGGLLGSAGAAASMAGGGGGGFDIMSLGSWANAGKTMWKGFSGMMNGEGLSGFTGMFGGSAVDKLMVPAHNLTREAAQQTAQLSNAVNTWGPILAGVGGAIQGWQTGNKANAVTGAAGGYFGAKGGAALGTAILPGIGTAIGAALGAILGSSLGSSVFGGDWETTRGGIQLGFGGEEGGFDPKAWERQTKKGGWFSSTKRRFRFNELDDETDAMLNEAYDKTISGIESLYDQIGVSVEDGTLEGVRIAMSRIGTSGKSEQTEEEIQKQITEWFNKLAEAMVDSVDGSLDMESLQKLATSLTGFNNLVGSLGMTMLEVSKQGAEAAQNIIAIAGGVEQLTSDVQEYYKIAFSEEEKLGHLREQVTGVFDRLGVTMPDSVQGLRQIIEGLDRTTESGQATWSALIKLTPAFNEMVEATKAMAEAERQIAIEGARENLALLEEATQKYKDKLTLIHEDRLALLDQEKETLEKSISEARANIDSVFAAFQRGIEQRREMIEAQAQAEIDAINGQRGAITSSYDKIAERINVSMSTVQETIQRLQREANLLKNALGRVSVGDSETTLARQRMGVDAIRGGATGDALEQAVGFATSATAEMFSDRASFERNQSRAGHAISDRLDSTTADLNSEEGMLSFFSERLTEATDQRDRELTKLDEQINVILEHRDRALAGLEQQVELAQKQVDAVDGVSTNVATLSEVTSAIATYEETQEMALMQIDAIDRERAVIQRQFEQELEYLDAELAHNTASLENAIKQQQDINAIYGISNTISGKLSTIAGLLDEDGTTGYATGGIASGPTSGYWERLHGTEAVIPMGRGNIPVVVKGNNNDEVVSEIRELRRDVNHQSSELQRIRNNTGDSASFQKKTYYADKVAAES